VPRKVFVAGEILTAANVNTNLMDQAVMSFAGTAARGSAIPSPSEGMVSYLADSDSLSVYNGSSWIPAASGATLGAGSILQVVQTVKTDTFSASVAGGGVSADAIAASITPKFASSKVLVLVQFTGSVSGASGLYAYLYKDAAVSAYRGDAAGNRVRAVGSGQGDGISAITALLGHIAYLDSPATTSSTTYSLRLGHSQSTTQTVLLNRSSTDTDSSAWLRGASSITLMEVAG
jgi:hypothetical protein